MSTTLNEYKIDAGNYKRLDGGGGENQSWRNTTGTPITSVTPNDEGNLIAGLYTITFATGSVVPGVSATALVASADPKNPNINTSPGVAVVLDGSTPNKGVIRGLSIVFSSSGSFNEGWAGKVYTGSYYLSPDEKRVTPFGTQDDGATSAAQRLAKARSITNGKMPSKARGATRRHQRTSLAVGADDVAGWHPPR